MVFKYALCYYKNLYEIKPYVMALQERSMSKLSKKDSATEIRTTLCAPPPMFVLRNK